MPNFPVDYRVNKHRPCPICGKPDWCLIDPNGEWALCMRVPSSRPTKNGGWLHTARKTDVGQPRIRSNISSGPHLPPYKILDLFYRSLLAHTEPALEWLLSRGYSGESADFLSNYCRVCSEALPLEGGLIEQANEMDYKYLERIPGLFADNGRWMWRRPDGVMIAVLRMDPIKDMILGWQIRQQTDSSSKYVWYSSAGMERGCKAKAFSCLLGHSGVLVVVEGIFKALALYAMQRCFGQPFPGDIRVLGVPGISLWPSQIPKAILATGASRIILAPDLDCMTNVHVMQSLKASLMITERIARDIRMAYWEWGYDEDGRPWPKGIDDACLTGHRISLVSTDRYWDKLLTGVG